MGLVAICPYFLKDRGGYTYCEVCRFKFKGSQMRKNFLNRYCASFDYKSCPIAALTDTYYEKGDDYIEKDDNDEII